jgi:hypothetical protein
MKALGVTRLAFALLVLLVHKPVLAQSTAALMGKVVSDREGPMEGVLVSAKKDHSTITVTVVSNAEGEYGFPASRLEPGRYTLAVRAAGYTLGGEQTATLTQGKTSIVNLKLDLAQPRLDQLANAELLMSAPGSDEIKRLMLNCTDCHGLQRIFNSRHSEAEFLKVFERMGGYYPGASDMQPQRLAGEHRRPPVPANLQQKFAEYLASINLNDRTEHAFEIKMLERPKGRATKVVITEYDLPRREIQPHDVVVDPDGMVWFSHFGEQFLSKMDPRTGKTTDYPIPVQKPDHPKGLRAISATYVSWSSTTMRSRPSSPNTVCHRAGATLIAILRVGATEATMSEPWRRSTTRWNTTTARGCPNIRKSSSVGRAMAPPIAARHREKAALRSG